MGIKHAEVSSEKVHNAIITKKWVKPSIRQPKQPLIPSIPLSTRTFPRQGG